MKVENPVDPWDPKAVGVFYPPRLTMAVATMIGSTRRRDAARTMQPLEIWRARPPNSARPAGDQPEHAQS